MGLLLRRWAMMPKKVSGECLPSEYQEVEHIVNGSQNYVDYGGNAFLDLDISVTDEDAIKLVARILVGGAHLLGGRSSSTSNNLMLFWETGEACFDYGDYRSNRKNLTGSLGNSTVDFVNITINKSGITVNSTVYPLSPVSPFATPNFYLLNGYNGYNASPKRAWVKSFEIEGKAKLIPCYRKSDGEIGMYDIIRNRFFTNAGTTAFGKGSDVN